MELTYEMRGDYSLPNLTVPDEPEIVLGKYALLRREYLKQHRKVLFTNLLTSGKLTAYLMEIEKAAQNCMEQIVTALGMMNNFRHAAEEIIRKELITS